VPDAGRKEEKRNSFHTKQQKPQSEENYRVRASSRKTGGENMEIEDNSVLDYNNDHNYKKGSITKYNLDKSDNAFQEDQFTQPEDPKKSYDNSN
jgi:hypothetical protein